MVERCVLCKDDEIYLKKLCRECYRKMYTKVDRCIDCKRLKAITAKGLCRSCYDKRRNNEQK